MPRKSIQTQKGTTAGYSTSRASNAAEPPRTSATSSPFSLATAPRSSRDRRSRSTADGLCTDAEDPGQLDLVRVAHEGVLTAWARGDVRETGRQGGRRAA